MITPERKTIRSILKGTENRFSVPAYQRSFDWGKTELQDLIDDLKDVKESNNIKELFLGNFIFDVSDKNNYKIVDGQQRLTTISIILIAIREHAKRLNELQFAGEVQEGYITIDSSWSDEQGNKISVSENIRELFEYISSSEWNGKFPDKINGKPVKRQVNKVRPIFNYVMEELVNYNKEDLKQFIKALLSAYVIVIHVENTEDVFSIFERTNARGLDLNIGDLLKNYIFAHQIDELEEKWRNIIENAESSLQRMLKYFYISRRGYVMQSSLYKKLKEYGNSIGIDDFVNDLYSFSRYFKTVQSLDEDNVREWLLESGLEKLGKDEDYYKRMNRVFQALKLFRVTQAYPLIYSLLKYYRDSKHDNFKDLLRVLETIEKYHFINNVISNRIGNEVEKYYAEKSKEFFESTSDFRVNTDTFIVGLQSKKALKAEFTANFIETVVYDKKNIEIINYVFDRINNYGTKGGQIVEIYAPDKDIKERNYNIEHILAQSKKDQFKTEEEQEKLHHIGNLLVISRHTNSELQNISPKEKIEIIQSDPKHCGNLRYFPVFINDYKDEFECWDLKSIEKRSGKMAEEAYLKYWNF